MTERTCIACDGFGAIAPKTDLRAIISPDGFNAGRCTSFEKCPACDGTGRIVRVAEPPKDKP